MTREEAITILECEKPYSNTGCGSTDEEIEEVLNMAIKALEQQPSEDEQIIRVKKGTLKGRTGRYVIYDAKWLKEHFNTTEAKIYGKPSEDCISREDY